MRGYARTFVARTLRKHTETLFTGGFFLRSNFLLHDVTLSYLFARVAICHIEGFSKLSKIVIDFHILHATTTGSKTLIQRDSIALVVLPIRNTRGDHPFFLLLSSHFTWWTS